jgi:hypothetical protein
VWCRNAIPLEVWCRNAMPLKVRCREKLFFKVNLHVSWLLLGTAAAICIYSRANTDFIPV